MLHLRLYICLWLLGLITAYFVGTLTGTDHQSEATDTAISRGSEETPTLRSPIEQITQVGESQVFLEDALTLESNEQFQKSFEALLPTLSDPRNHNALFILADVWASKDPVAATNWLAQLNFNDARNPYLFASFSKWASLDPTAAQAWLNQNQQENQETNDYMLASLIRGLAVSDPDSALKILLAAPNSPERSGSLEFLIKSWKGLSLKYAFAQVAALPDASGVLKEQAIQKLTASLSSDQIEAAQDWASGLAANEDQLAARIGIAARWSQRDPEAALEWATTLSDPETQSRALGEVGARWARIDPIAASAWLAENSGQQTTDLAARRIAWSTVGIDPDLAFSQVAEITYATLREETFEQVGRFWLSRQPQTAKQFLERESDLPEDIRENLLRSFE